MQFSKLLPYEAAQWGLAIQKHPPRTSINSNFRLGHTKIHGKSKLLDFKGIYTDDKTIFLFFSGSEVQVGEP